MLEQVVAISVPRRGALLVVWAALSLGGCVRGATSMTEPLRAAMAKAPDDLPLLYLAASDHALRGDGDGALALLECLDRFGYGFPLDPDDFPGIGGSDRFRAIAERIDGREPCVSRALVRTVVHEPWLIPDGLAVDPRDGTLFVASTFKHKIVRVKAGAVSDFARLDNLQVMGLHLDAARSALWAVGVQYDYGYIWSLDLHDGHVRVRVEGPSQGRRHLFKDVTVAEDGTAYVSDSFAGSVWQLRPGSRRLEPFLAPNTLYLPKGIASDGAHLLIAHQFGIVRVAPDGSLEPLGAPRGVSLAGIDGVHLEGDTLIAVQNAIGAPRIVQLDLSLNHQTVARATILETRNPLFHHPTTCVIDPTRREALVIADGYVDQVKMSALEDLSAPVSTTILAIPLQP